MDRSSYQINPICPKCSSEKLISTKKLLIDLQNQVESETKKLKRLSNPSI